MIPCSFKKWGRQKQALKQKFADSGPKIIISFHPSCGFLWPWCYHVYLHFGSTRSEQLVLQTESIRREKIRFRMIQSSTSLWWQPFDILSHIVFSPRKGLSDNRGISIEWKDIEGLTQRKENTRDTIFYTERIQYFRNVFIWKKLWYEYDQINK